MNTPVTIASKVFIRTFYLENASFFLLVLGVAGGFMRDVEHIALAEFFVRKPYLVLIPFAFWILYGFKILSFNTACLEKPQNQFFYQLVFFSRGIRFMISGLIILTQFMPAILYGFFLMATAVKHTVYDSFFVVIGSLIVPVLALVIQFMRLIHNPDQGKKTSLLIRKMNRTIIRPYPLFAIEWLSRKKTLMLLGTKAFGVLMLLAVAKLYTTGEYDFRLMGMALTVISGASAQLMFEIHRFDNHHFALVRQLPITCWKRISSLLVSILFLILPEAGIFITYYPADLSSPEMIQGIVFFVTILFFWYALLYRKNMDQEAFMKIVFWESMLIFVLILFRVPVWGIACVAFLAAVFRMSTYYYRFEYGTTTYRD
ncbi:MAG TPA: hypothetical protein VGK59_06200 [Ohtaekwangia sp.]